MNGVYIPVYIYIRIYIYVEQCVCVCMCIYIYSIDMHTFYLIYHTSPCITEFIYIIYGLLFFVGQVFLKRWKRECKRAAAADEWSDSVGDGFPPRETNAWWKVSFWEILWRVSELSHVKWQRKCRYSNIPAFSRRLVTQLEMFRPLEPRLLRLSLIYHCWTSCQVQQNARNHAWNTSATLSTIRITSCQGQGLRQNVTCDHHFSSTNVPNVGKSVREKVHSPDSSTAKYCHCLCHDGIVSWRKITSFGQHSHLYLLWPRFSRNYLKLNTPKNTSITCRPHVLGTLVHLLTSWQPLRLR